MLYAKPSNKVYIVIYIICNDPWWIRFATGNHIIQKPYRNPSEDR